MDITLPNIIASEAKAENHAVITVSPCYPGYGTTLGNAMRRVLLSSLPGAAVTAIKIKGVDHEFSTIDHVKEDVVEIILNIKNLRFVVHGDEPVEIELHAKGDGVITAKQFEKNALIEVASPDAVIATMTDKAGEFHLKAIIQKGRGYIPVEEREGEKLEIGYIAIDSIYTPIRNVNFHTENVRVGEMTNFDKLSLDILTDGTVSPEDAFGMAANILVEQFGVLTRGLTDGVVEADTEETTDEPAETE
jgi:DNA-directed RNA polymerase subunit alpha